MTRSSLRAAILAAAASIALAAAADTTLRGYTVAPAAGSRSAYSLAVDSITFRSDLVRVYGHICGHPNTSARIDGFEIAPSADMAAALAARKAYKATDIDGFDFERRFQWEEDGDIPVEIDFPPFKGADVMTIRSAGPDGFHLWTLRHKGATRSKGGRR